MVSVVGRKFIMHFQSQDPRVKEKNCGMKTYLRE